MPILRLHIYQPHAHYRIPFTYQRRHTYPIPPYSTVIGFLVNACGVDDQKNDIYKNVISKLKISIAGRFEVINTENIWFRNLSKDSHERLYGTIDNREKNGNIGHVGGQSPIRIDVLENVELIIYLYHKDDKSLKILRDLLISPKNRLQILHLGRAEDWIVYKTAPQILDINNLEITQRDANYNYFMWIPEKVFKINGSPAIDFEKVEGNIYRIATFSHIVNYEKYFNHTGKRIYKYILSKLNDGKIYGYELLIDKEFNLPIFLGDLQ